MFKQALTLVAVAVACAAPCTAQAFRPGAQGPQIKRIQTQLRFHGYPVALDGIYGSRTTNAVKAFQRLRTLPATGRVDTTTLRALERPLAQGDRGRAVRTLQAQLNRHGARLQVDGAFGARTEQALRAFQRRQRLRETRTLDPRTRRALSQPVAARRPARAAGAAAPARTSARTHGGISTRTLRAIMPRLSVRAAQIYTPLLNQAMNEAKITTARRRAAFLATLAHESEELTRLEERASGANYEGNRRLGNTRRGDGRRYKGRGPIQLTGRTNYRHAGQALKVDLQRAPWLAAAPSIGFRVAAWYWTSRRINRLADRMDLRGVTRRVNGGLNGYSSRLRYYRRALRALRSK